MNTTSHPIAPEEIMALLDGELPASEAHNVSTHLATCAECADLAEQFRSTSQWLARWEVEPVPSRLEAPVEQFAVPLPLPRKRWSWKPWLYGGGGVLATACIVIAFVISTYGVKQTVSHKEMLVSHSDTLGLFSNDKSDRFSGRGLEQLGKGTPAPMKFEQMDRAAKLMAAPAIKQPPSAAPPPPITAPAPMIARTVSMSILVKDVAQSRTVLDSILLRHHGYSAQMNVSTPEYGARSFNASLRIPTLELTAALAECKSLGLVENEIQSGEEVTQQHADLLARLHNSRETEERFRAILAQRTGKVSDVLEVEESIARVRGEIEQMEAEQQTLEHRVEFATVDLQLTEQYKASLDTRSDATGPRLHNAFVAGYRNASQTIVGIILFLAEYGPSILIWLTILGIPAWLIWRRRKRIR